MRDVKVIYLLEHWLPPGTAGSTGGTLYNYQLVAALAKHVDVSVIALNTPDPSVPEGVKLDVFKEMGTGVRGARALSWRKTLTAQLPMDSSCTVLITTSATNAVLGIARKRGFKTVSIVQAYEDFGWSVPGANLRQRIKSLKRLLATGQGLKPSLRYADTVLVNSKYMQGQVRGLIGPELDTRLLYPPLTLSLNLKNAFNAKSMNSVGFVNRAGKNVQFVAELARLVPEKTFLVFGHRLPDQFEMPANMHFIGWANDRAEMFKQAYTWVMPSVWHEPFGLVAVEALSQGRRLGVSDRGGLPEAVGVAGKVFSDFDVENWRQWLISDTHRVHRGMLVSHLREYSRETFDKNVFLIFNSLIPGISKSTDWPKNGRH